jgi:hypothetical protein
MSDLETRKPYSPSTDVPIKLPDQFLLFLFRPSEVWIKLASTFVPSFLIDRGPTLSNIRVQEWILFNQIAIFVGVRGSIDVDVSLVERDWVAEGRSLLELEAFAAFVKLLLGG